MTKSSKIVRKNVYDIFHSCAIWLFAAGFAAASTYMTILGNFPAAVIIFNVFWLVICVVFLILALQQTKSWLGNVMDLIDSVMEDDDDSDENLSTTDSTPAN